MARSWEKFTIILNVEGFYVNRMPTTGICDKHLSLVDVCCLGTVHFYIYIGHLSISYRLAVNVTR